MSATGDRRRDKLMRELDEAENDLEWSGWEAFICWIISCAVVIVIGALGVMAWDHIADHWRPKPTIELYRAYQAPTEGRRGVVTADVMEIYPCPVDGIDCSSTTAVNAWNETH